MTRFKCLEKNIVWNFENFALLTREALNLEIIHQKNLCSDSEFYLINGYNKDDVKEDSKILSADEESIGYPAVPYFKRIAASLWNWVEYGKHPIDHQRQFHGFTEEPYKSNRSAIMNSVKALLEGLKVLWKFWCRDEIIYRIRIILRPLGKRGLLDLLGMRITIGTKDLFPPIERNLVDGFKRLHNKSSILSVGARALSKHHHRDSTQSWWGDCTGTEQQKNTHSLKVLLRILGDAEWINIHLLTPDMIHIIEVRQSEGYGARWGIEGYDFRGFLEPMMIGGHESGWKH